MVEQPRRPNKRMFALTAAGRRELRDFVARPARPTAIRDDLLVKLMAADDGDHEAMRDAFAARLEHARGKLAFYDQLRAALLDGRTEETYLDDAERVGPYLTLMGGRLYERQNIRWCTAVLRALGRRSAR